MSGSEGKSDVQVTRPNPILTSPGLAFPFGPSSTPPHPHITQWCRFSVPEHSPLKPFRQDRLTKLPLPPSVMATSNKVGSSVPISSPAVVGKGLGLDVDPIQKVQQLERSLSFVKESHAVVLQSLHEEIEELKRKNKELQFQLVTGISSLPEQNNELKSEDISEEYKEKLEKVEKEVKKLRNALKEALKTNTSLTNQLQLLKREHYMSAGSSGGYPRSPTSTPPDGQRAPTPSGHSPRIDEYSDTLRQIQRAAGRKSRAGNDGRHVERMNGDWGGYAENRRGYNQHYHHQQPRLPRLPLRNHQNYSHQEFDIQYRQRNSNALPALKQPLIPLVEHGEKPRKPRGPPRARVPDHVPHH